MEMKVFAIDRWNSLWRVAMVDVCDIPSSEMEAEDRLALYAVVKGVFNAVEEQAEMICKMRKRTKLHDHRLTAPCTGTDNPYKFLTVVGSPS
jgi:hypothetical protein